MTDHTFIPGKDAALEDSIERFQIKVFRNQRVILAAKKFMN